MNWCDYCPSSTVRRWQSWHSRVCKLCVITPYYVNHTSLQLVENVIVRWPINELSLSQNHRQTGTWHKQTTQKHVLVCTLQLPLNPNMKSQLFPTPSLQTRSMKEPWPFFASSSKKTSIRPLPSFFSFIYHIFCPTETFQRGRESHQPVTRRAQWPHRKLLIPAGMSWALENGQTQWT